MMAASSLSVSAAFQLVGNHLWQSTVCLAVVALLTLVVRGSRAHVRYGLWLAASIKFLVPFAPLMALGHQIAWRSPAPVQPAMSLLVDTMSLPFSQPDLQIAAATSSGSAAHSLGHAAPALLLGIWFVGCAAVLLTWWAGWRRVAATVRHGHPMEEGREVDTLRRLEQIDGLDGRIAVIASDTSFEPGVFGIVKPVLLWPLDIGPRLDDGQLEAILAHEVCHVRRRDNLAVAVHMFVEAVFWFHPLVWWLEARLVDEREQACDEEVIRWGSQPHVYAESILKTCEFCVESPSACVSGVTGSDLKRRIEAIMSNQAGETLNGWRKLLLATTGMIAVAAPLAVGAMNAPQPSPDAGGQAPALLTSAEAAGCHRLITVLFNTVIQPSDLRKAVEMAQQWVDEQMAPSDLVAVATIGSSLQVLTDFTSSKEQVTSALSAVSATATDSPQSVDASAQELDTFNNEIRLRALKTLADALAPIQQKKAILYFGQGIQRNGTDNLVDLRAAVTAAMRANVAIYPVDARLGPQPGDRVGQAPTACAPPK
jgi:beta-lactamase regulating signal transducer with metallopeptidase domain